MIDIIKQTPDCYSKQSLDYQIISRLYTALFNLSKMYTDNMCVWDTNIDNKLLKLRATTLNFNIKHTWNLDELEAVTSCYKYLARSKGSLSALSYCINILLKALGLKSIVSEDNINIDAKKCYITVYADVDNIVTGIIEDLVAHLLPAGWRYRVIQYKEATITPADNVEVFYMPDEISYINEQYTDKMFIGESSENLFDTTYIYRTSEGGIYITNGGEI